MITDVNPADNLQDDHVVNPADLMSACDDDALPTSQVPEDGRLRRSAAMFLLTLKEQYHLPQTAVDLAVSEVQKMVCFSTADTQHVAQCILEDNGVEVPNFVCDSITTDPFEDLLTEHKQTKFYRENFNLVVSLVML